ncbi:MAG TPA: head GIN domain-containing protein [Niastella sp.]|nr:head GIN domain-containing protein [Niastella sp.]
MFKHLITPILLLINLMGLGQGKVIYDPNVEKRPVSSFHAITVSDGIDLYLSQGGEEVLAVSATEAGHRDRIKTVVENGELKIYVEQGWNWKFKKLTAYVSVKEITRLRASGGSDIVVKDSLKCDKLDIRLSGGSDFTGQLTANFLTIEQSGGSDASMKGNVANAKVVASGGSDFRGYDLIAENAILQTSGGSDASITVIKEMAAMASGGSDVNYKGNPVIKYKSANGGGSVTKRGE